MKQKDKSISAILGKEWRCPKCKYIQITKSKLNQITCSNCGLKSNRENNLINKKVKE